LWSLQCFPDLAGLKGRLALREGEGVEGRIREERDGGRHEGIKGRWAVEGREMEVWQTRGETPFVIPTLRAWRHLWLWL